MTAPPADQMWNTEQVAAHLQMGTRYIQQLVREGRIPFVRFGRSLRFRPDEIDKWVLGRQTRAVR